MISSLLALSLFAAPVQHNWRETLTLGTDFTFVSAPRPKIGFSLEHRLINDIFIGGYLQLDVINFFYRPSLGLVITHEW